MKTQILPPTTENLQMVSEQIKNGSIGALPTETVYGLAGNLRNEQSILNIFQTKNRPSFDPLIVHTAYDPELNAKQVLYKLEDKNLINLNGFSSDALLKTENLIEAFWPGALTLIFPKGDEVSDLITSGLNTVALRMPKHPYFQEVLKRSQCEICAPSANRFGRISPTQSNHVLTELEGKIPWILDGGNCKIGIESTIVFINLTGEVQLLRPGAIEKEKIEEILNEPVVSSCSNIKSNKPLSPGTLKSHYAPKKPLFLFHSTSELSTQFDCNKKTAILFFQENDLEQFTQAHKEANLSCYQILTKNGEPAVAAKNLFASLRTLDESTAEILYAQTCPTNKGLEFAINDRLKRAAC